MYYRKNVTVQSGSEGQGFLTETFRAIHWYEQLYEDGKEKMGAGRAANAPTEGVHSPRAAPPKTPRDDFSGESPSCLTAQGL